MNGNENTKLKLQKKFTLRDNWNTYDPLGEVFFFAAGPFFKRPVFYIDLLFFGLNDSLLPILIHRERTFQSCSPALGQRGPRSKWAGLYTPMSVPQKTTTYWFHTEMKFYMSTFAFAEQLPIFSSVEPTKIESSVPVSMVESVDCLFIFPLPLLRSSDVEISVH